MVGPGWDFLGVARGQQALQERYVHNDRNSPLRRRAWKAKSPLARNRTELQQSQNRSSPAAQASEASRSRKGWAQSYPESPTSAGPLPRLCVRSTPFSRTLYHSKVPWGYKTKPIRRMRGKTFATHVNSYPVHDQGYSRADWDSFPARRAVAADEFVARGSKCETISENSG